MNLTKYDPLKTLGRMDDWFWGSEREQIFAPAVDIHESEKDVELRVEVPGMNKKDVKIEVVNDYLRISGEKKYEKKDQEAKRLESYYGKFERSFYLGDKLNANAVQAEAKDGILTIRIDKKEEQKPKEIEIK